MRAFKQADLQKSVIKTMFQCGTNVTPIWYIGNKKGRETSALFVAQAKKILNKQADIGFARELEERGRTAILESVDKVGMLKAEQFNGHLAGNEFDFSFLA